MFTGGKIVIAPNRIRTAIRKVLFQRLRGPRALLAASGRMEMVMR